MTTLQVIRWWEIRRIPYNAILFAIGIASIFTGESLMGQEILESSLAILAYGIMANLCYTLGWVIELIGRRTDENRARLRGRKQFWVGFWFSCLLTTAPFWFGLIFWLSHRTR